MPALITVEKLTKEYRVQARALVPQLTRAIGLIARNQPTLAPVTGAVWEIARALDLQPRFDLALA